MADTPEKTLRVLHAAVRDADYPRARRIRQYFQAHGDEVRTTAASFRRSKLRNVLVTTARIMLQRGPFDVVLLAEFSTQYATATRLKAWLHGAVHVVDGFVGLYETVVEDRADTSSGSARARLVRLVDRTAARSSDVLLADTDIRSKSLSRRHGISTTCTLPVGAPSWAHPTPLKAPDDVIKVLYYGGLIPLHGFDTILDAVAVAAARRKVHLTAVGPIGDHPALRSRIERPDLVAHVTVVSPVPESELAAIIAQHDVVLGIFGTSRKASTVIANKVWQALACGRPVVTRESEALAEISSIVGDQLQTVPAGDAEALSEVLCTRSWPSIAITPSVNLELEAYVSVRYAAFHSSLLSTVSRRRTRRGLIRLVPTRRAP